VKISFLCLLTFSFLSLASFNSHADQLSDTWNSCNDDQSRNTGSTLQFSSGCYFQEVEASQGDRLTLDCNVTTSDYSSVSLGYADSDFDFITLLEEATYSSTSLQIPATTAPQNTRYAVVTLNADSSASIQCTLTSRTLQSDTLTRQTATGTCIDTDGDGYGWNGFATCSVPNTSSDNSFSERANSAGDCVDPDGDGFGWNGVSTCLISSTAATSNTPGPCLDPDNDGFGWNGVATCRLDNSTNTNTGQPNISTITDLILLTGQSNAQGQGSRVDLAVLDAPNNQVFAYTDDGDWQVADLRQHWDGPEQPRRPGNNALIYPNNTPHNNLALHFGKALVELDPQRVVGFIIATSPGSGIRTWDKGSSFYQTISNKASRALGATSKSNFDAVLWHQGETDFQFFGTSDPNAPVQDRQNSTYYPDRLNGLISNFRAEPWFNENRGIFICAETQTTSTAVASAAPVNSRLMALNSDNDPYTGCVTSNGLQTRDGVHFNAEAIRSLGRRYATEYLRISRQ